MTEVYTIDSPMPTIILGAGPGRRPDTYDRPGALDWHPSLPDRVTITHQDEFGPVFSDGVRREWRGKP